MRRLALAIGLSVAVAHVAPARADELGELTKMLASSSSDKARLSAVTALARLGDKRTLKPLVTAMHDPNAGIRAIAASALGRLAHKAALPTLKDAAANDPDEAVRAKATVAAASVAKANNIADDSAPAAPVVSETKPRHAGFGRQAHAVDNHPDYMIVINSSSDDSPGKLDKASRKAHSEALRNELAAELRAQPSVTTVAADAAKWGLDTRHLDLSIVKMEVVQSGTYMEIEAQLRLAISDDKGRMMSFVSGGAKVQIPKKTFDLKYLPALRKEAVENAARGLFDKLLGQLRNRSQS